MENQSLFNEQNLVYFLGLIILSIFIIFPLFKKLKSFHFFEIEDFSKMKSDFLLSLKKVEVRKRLFFSSLFFLAYPLFMWFFTETPKDSFQFYKNLSSRLTFEKFSPILSLGYLSIYFCIDLVIIFSILFCLNRKYFNFKNQATIKKIIITLACIIAAFRTQAVFLSPTFDWLFLFAAPLLLLFFIIYQNTKNYFLGDFLALTFICNLFWNRLFKSYQLNFLSSDVLLSFTLSIILIFIGFISSTFYKNLEINSQNTSKNLIRIKLARLGIFPLLTVSSILLLPATLYYLTQQKIFEVLSSIILSEKFKLLFILIFTLFNIWFYLKNSFGMNQQEDLRNKFGFSWASSSVEFRKIKWMIAILYSIPILGLSIFNQFLGGGTLNSIEFLCIGAFLYHVIQQAIEISYKTNLENEVPLLESVDDIECQLIEQVLHQNEIAYRIENNSLPWILPMKNSINNFKFFIREIDLKFARDLLGIPK